MSLKKGVTKSHKMCIIFHNNKILYFGKITNGERLYINQLSISSETGIRRICESVLIRRKRPQIMNKDEGAHFLSYVFNPILTGSTPSAAGVRPIGNKCDQCAG